MDKIPAWGGGRKVADIPLDPFSQGLRMWLAWQEASIAQHLAKCRLAEAILETYRYLGFEWWEQFFPNPRVQEIKAAFAKMAEKRRVVMP